MGWWCDWELLENPVEQEGWESSLKKDKMLLAGSGVEIEGGSEERKPPSARQDGSYYAFKPLLKGAGRLFQ